MVTARNMDMEKPMDTEVDMAPADDINSIQSNNKPCCWSAGEF